MILKATVGDHALCTQLYPLLAVPKRCILNQIRRAGDQEQMGGKNKIYIHPSMTKKKKVGHFRMRGKKSGALLLRPPFPPHSLLPLLTYLVQIGQWTCGAAASHSSVCKSLPIEHHTIITTSAAVMLLDAQS